MYKRTQREKWTTKTTRQYKHLPHPLSSLQLAGIDKDTIAPVKQALGNLGPQDRTGPFCVQKPGPVFVHADVYR